MAVNGHAGALQANLRGEVIDRGHPGYDEARSLYNAMIDRHMNLSNSGCMSSRPNVHQESRMNERRVSHPS